MADTVTSRYLLKGRRRHVLELTNVSDGTGESNVAKAILSGLTVADGIQVPTFSAVDMVDFAITGFSSVTLKWDHTAPDTIAVLPPGVGTIHWWAAGGLVDPKSAGGTGNLTVSTTGGASGSTYNLTIWFRCKQ